MKDNFYGKAYYDSRILGWKILTNIQHHTFVPSIPDNQYDGKCMFEASKYRTVYYSKLGRLVFLG